MKRKKETTLKMLQERAAQEWKRRILKVKDILEARMNNMQSKGDGPASRADPADYRNPKKSLTVYMGLETYYFQTGINKWYERIDPGIFYSFSDFEKRRVTRHGLRFALDWFEQNMED